LILCPNSGPKPFEDNMTYDTGAPAPDDDLRLVSQDEEADEAPEFHEIEHQGQTYQIPAALKGAFLMQGDYTRKTQELAEHRRGLEAERKALEHHAETAHANIADRAQLHLLEEQLAGFQEVDWGAFAQQDPEQAQALWAQYQQVSELHDRYAWKMAHHAHQGQLEAERQAAAQLTQTGKVLAQKIEGWSPEIASKLVEYAGAFGVTLEELREIADPRLWLILHRAHQGEEAAKQQATSRQMEQTQAVRPAISVSGAAGAGGSVRDELATKDWMAKRNAQTGRRR
jgi:hypothetical protein